jgi:hypothetical protein
MALGSVAEELHALAARHERVVLSSDLSALGLGRGAVARLRQEGWLAGIRHGAALVGGGPASDWQRAVAAVLVAGPSAALSHWTAAKLHRLAVVPPEGAPEIELSVPWPTDRRLAGVHVHRVRSLAPPDLTEHRSVRVTTPERTLLDLAPQIPTAALEKLVDEGVIARWWTIESLRCAFGPVRRGRPPIDELRDIVAARLDGRRDSHLEVRAVDVLACAAPFETQYQVVLKDRVLEVDIAWPLLKVAVECEGWLVRVRSRSKFDHERRKFNLLAAAGWTVIHVTAAMSDDEIRSAVIPVLLAAGRR